MKLHFCALNRVVQYLTVILESNYLIWFDYLHISVSVSPYNINAVKDISKKKLTALLKH